MKIETDQLGKRFNRQWIFRDLSLAFESGKVYAITGPNGSGKSTLLQILWGQLPATTGKVRYINNEKPVGVEDVFQHISIAAPYMDLIDEFSLEEMVTFHFKFKRPVSGATTADVIGQMELGHAMGKKVGQFSSGMKQRLKLGLAFCSETSLLFLDEPSTNLDEESIAWYHRQLPKTKERVVLIASNQADEYPPHAIKIPIHTFK